MTNWETFIQNMLHQYVDTIKVATVTTYIIDPQRPIVYEYDTNDYLLRERLQELEEARNQLLEEIQNENCT